MPPSSSTWRISVAALAACAAGLSIIAVAAARAVEQTPAPAAPILAPLLPGNAEPVRTCESLKTVSLPDVTIDSAMSDSGAPANAGNRGGQTVQAFAPFCSVTATLTHPPAQDQIKIWIGLPMSHWNGRFQGTGGGGFSGGSQAGIRPPVSMGFAAGATDTGHTGGSGSFALDATGHLNWQLIRDNAYLGIHEMTVVGQALTREFYGVAPHRAYFNGCSTGGRQGLMEAQRYPADYDGILAGAPAINWTKLHVEQLWGGLSMLESKNPVPVCKFQAATQAAIIACDGIDGVKDGTIEDPKRCTYDPKALVGTTAGACGTFTQADADVIHRIWEGPRRRDGSFLWYGLARGADFSGLSGTGGSPLEPRPNNITLEWWRFFLNQNPQWDWKSLTRAGYEQYWDQSVEEFSAVIGTDTPDLSAFRDRGGRLVMWHGQADPLIYPEGSIDYYTRVQQHMGGAGKTSPFIRHFLAPGVGHCGGGTGPAPIGQFDAVVKWVEEGKAPVMLNAARRDQAGTIVRTRPLCPYPLVARYQGRGSTDDAANFECRASF